MLESGTRTGSDELKAVFETHLGATGRMLLMLDSFVQPKYISRAWCIFESFVCVDKKFAMSIILPESSGAKFKQTLDSAGGPLPRRAVECSYTDDQRVLYTVYPLQCSW